jgi:hypothetical protein
VQNSLRPNGYDSDLDVSAAVDYHSHPGVMSRTWKSKAEFHDDFYKVLKETGEHDPTGKGVAKKIGSGCNTFSSFSLFFFMGS